MGFFRKDDAPRWIDSAPFEWVPEQPLSAEPGFAPGGVRFAEPDAPPVPANTDRRPSRFGLRLGIGLVQGLGFYILFHFRGAGLWPGSDPTLFAGLALAGLFAPQLLLEGLDGIPAAILAAWASAAAVGLMGLGFYHHWRIQAPDQMHTGFALALLAATMLFAGQALLHAALRRERPGAALFDARWTLAGRVLVWMAVAGFAWALVGSGNSLLNWLRPRYPMLHIAAEPALLVMPLVGLAGALGWQVTALPHVARAVRNALVTVWTVALPVLAAVAICAVAVHLFTAPVACGYLLALGFALAVAFDASCRPGDENRARWRRVCEAAAAGLVLLLSLLAALALARRVMAFGWTDTRIHAAAATAFLLVCGLGYGAAILVGSGGKGWTGTVAKVRPMLALTLMALCLALTTPLGDPLKLAAASQAARVETGAVAPWQFDFGWMRRHGGRFGQAALAALTRSPDAEIARDAAVFLSLAPGLPAPTMIGANIHVRSAGARLPASLLTTDWSKVKGPVPPCLTGVSTGCDAWFLDFDNDGAAEILLAYGDATRWWAAILKKSAAGWAIAGTLAAPPCPAETAAMRAGDFALVPPSPGWRDLMVGGTRLHVAPAASPPGCDR